MKILFLALSCFLGANLSLAQDKAKVKASAAQYVKDGKALLAMINSGKVDPTEGEKFAYSMVDQAVIVAKEYIASDKKSEKVLNYVIGSINELKKAKFETLEKDWHDAGKLTPDKVGLNLKDEANEKYMDPIHCILHPIMTAVALKSKDLKSAKDELTEGLEQMSLQEKALAK